jgi:two-component system chemotaxis sensor kinase CheA
LKVHALPDELVVRFRVIATERIERIEALWSSLTSGRSDTDDARKLDRELHTLKGEARAIGFVDVDLLCHRLEAMASLALEKNHAISDDFDLLFVGAIQFVAMLIRKRPGQSFGGIDLAGFVAQLDQMITETRPLSKPRRSTTARRRIAPPGIDRVSPRTVEELADSATRVFLESLKSYDNKQSLRGIWSDLARRVQDLAAAPVEPRIEPLITSSLGLAAELGRQVDITLDATDARVSAEVLDVLSTAVMHGLRNAIDHGIEPAEERSKAGKSPAGNVVVRVISIENHVRLAIDDDGRGLDPAVLRRRAVECGLLSASQAESVSVETLYELPLTHGFTTRDQASMVSGRGIGLDVVRELVQSRGGRVTLGPRYPTGARLLVDLADNGWSIPVHVMSLPESDTLFAVPRDWSLEPTREVGSDVLFVLGVRADACTRGSSVAFCRGQRSLPLLVAGPPRAAVAKRLCPTRARDRVEVVEIDGREALLIHPDAWLGLNGLSSHPPSSLPPAGGAA